MQFPEKNTDLLEKILTKFHLEPQQRLLSNEKSYKKADWDSPKSKHRR